MFRCDGCEAVLQGIEKQIIKANTNKENNIKIKQKIDQEVIAHSFSGLSFNFSKFLLNSEIQKILLKF